MRARILLLLTVLTVCMTALGQMPTSTEDVAATRPFKHLDLSLTTGTTGVGFDVSMPINDVFSVRASYATMPHFTHAMHFGVDVGEDPATSQAKFNKLSGLLEGFTGNKVDNVVSMNGKPTYWNWGLMIDVRPLHNKHWHFTAGVFAGNRQVAEAINMLEDMPSLMAVSIYNNLYEKSLRNEPFITYGDVSLYNDDVAEKILNYGKMSIHIGDYKRDIYYEEDVYYDLDYPSVIGDNYYEPGDIIHAKGDVKHKKGDAYRMTPDENSLVKAWAYAKKIKPYLGFGYGGKLLKKDTRWQVSFDCGAMFWGGTPKIVTHDGTDLVNDVENVRGKVGDYVNIIKKFKVFPVLNFRLTRRLF